MSLCNLLLVLPACPVLIKAEQEISLQLTGLGCSRTFHNMSLLLRVKYGDVSDYFMYNVPSVSDSMIMPATLCCLFIISCAAEGGSVRC